MADIEKIRNVLFQMRDEANASRTALEGVEASDAAAVKSALETMQRQSAVLSGILLELTATQQPTPAQLQESERQAAINRIWTENHLKGANDRSAHVVELAVVTMRSVFLVNGAAVVALLTFLGTGRGPADSVMMRVAFQDFGIGLVLALLAMGVAYVAQQQFSLSEYDKANAVYTAVIRNEAERPNAGGGMGGLIAQIGAFCLAAGSLLFFILGSFASLEALFANA